MFFTGLLVLFSCRKDIEYYIQGRAASSPQTLENAKIFYLVNLDSENVGNRLNPHWKDSWAIGRDDGSSLLVVPSNGKKLNNKDFTFRRFFIFSLSGDEVADGRIVEF